MAYKQDSGSLTRTLIAYKYNSTIRRRTRSAIRFTAGCLTARSLKLRESIPSFWWNKEPNFGDALTPWLLPHYGAVPRMTVPTQARFAGVGSILEMLPKDYEGAIWGSGSLHGNPISLPKAQVFALRGELSLEMTGHDVSTVLGDPGLLVARHIRIPKRSGLIGVVPHHSHVGHATIRAFALRNRHQVRVIPPTAPVGYVIREIARCDAVISSSLHGLIVADSFGIPAGWTTLAPALAGADFKFRDYSSVSSPNDIRFIPNAFDGTTRDLRSQLRSIDAGRRERICDDLTGALRGALNAIRA